MIACISSCVGASTNAKPLDSCVSWLRMTLTESATRSSAASHCLISSAVTHIGRLPRKTVKLIQWFDLLRCWIVLQKEGSDLCQFDSSRPRKPMQTKKPLSCWKNLGKRTRKSGNTCVGKRLMAGNAIVTLMSPLPLSLRTSPSWFQCATPIGKNERTFLQLVDNNADI